MTEAAAVEPQADETLNINKKAVEALIRVWYNGMSDEDKAYAEVAFPGQTLEDIVQAQTEFAWNVLIGMADDQAS